jgi:hypothetical protein
MDSDDRAAPGTPWPAPGGDDPPPPHTARTLRPTLPETTTRPAPPSDPARPTPGAATWYRSDADRSKSVYRRANPWYRRLARGVIGLVVVAAIGAGLFVGARVVRDLLDRDRLPSVGADVPTIRTTSFIVSSRAPAPSLDGTITLDTQSRAFEFVGDANGSQAGVEVASRDGSTVYVRTGDGTWRPAGDGDTIVGELRRAIDYLVDDDTADDILTDRLRRGYVDLVEQQAEGTGDQRVTRYELSLDTRAFALDFPLQWQAFRESAIPGVEESAALPVTIWLDTDQVLVRVRDEATGWSWQRLAYSADSFAPSDPMLPPG